MGLTFEEIGGWPGVLARLTSGVDLSAPEAACALDQVLAGDATAAQIAGFVIGLRTKGETVEEMAGMVRSMLEHATALAIAGDLVDTCGTGGDRSGSINVSTAAAFVLAGAGARVCKHGGRAATSAAGSADVLEALGVAFDLGPAGVTRCVEEVGMGFCFAPRFHPAMRFAAPVRRELGVATVFNFLGPLANPARAAYQVVGVGDPSMAETMVGVLLANGCRRAWVVHGADGLDELTTTTTSTLYDVDAERGPDVRRTTVDAAELGLARASLDDLRGGDAATNAEAVRRILDAARGPQRDIVLLNAAAGLVVVGLAPDLETGVAMAASSVDEGRAKDVLDGLVRVSQEAAATTS